jgi:hypothetical protein
MGKFVTPHLAGAFNQRLSFSQANRTPQHTKLPFNQQNPRGASHTARRVARLFHSRSDDGELPDAVSPKADCAQVCRTRFGTPFAREPTGFMASGGCLTAAMNDNDAAPIPIDPRWAAGQSLRSRRQRCQFAVRHSCACAGRLPKPQEIECKGLSDAIWSYCVTARIVHRQ